MMYADDVGFLTSGENQLSYACTRLGGGAKPIGILFVHADQGNRLGPHRMFVELAQAFNGQDYPTFRFDLRGCGDSGGVDSKGKIDEDVQDVTNAIKYFQKDCDLQGVILLGISRGARVAFNLLNHNELPLMGLMLLSTPCSSTKAAMKQVNGALNQYFQKLCKPHYLLKLCRGKVNFRGIIKTLAHAWKLKSRYAEKPNPKGKNSCPVLFIYGQSDPITVESLNFYRSLCQQHAIKMQEHVIPGANHSFFHYRWKEQIIEICQNWLKENNERSVDESRAG